MMNSYMFFNQNTLVSTVSNAPFQGSIFIKIACGIYFFYFLILNSFTYLPKKNSFLKLSQKKTIFNPRYALLQSNINLKEYEILHYFKLKSEKTEINLNIKFTESEYPLTVNDYKCISNIQNKISISWKRPFDCLEFENLKEDNFTLVLSAMKEKNIEVFLYKIMDFRIENKTDFNDGSGNIFYYNNNLRICDLNIGFDIINYFKANILMEINGIHENKYFCFENIYMI